MSDRGSTPSGIWPRNMRSMQPATMIGSNVGLGMNLKSFPPTSRSEWRALLHHLHAPLAELLVEVPGAGVEGLVVVVVGVDGAVSELHGVLSVPARSSRGAANVITFRPARPPAGRRVPWRLARLAGRDSAGRRRRRAHDQDQSIAREARADRRRAARPDRQRRARGGRVARVASPTWSSASACRARRCARRCASSRPRVSSPSCAGCSVAWSSTSPTSAMTARTAALVLQARNVTLGDVHQARSMIEPAAVRVLASSPTQEDGRRARGRWSRPSAR